MEYCKKCNRIRRCCPRCGCCLDCCACVCPPVYGSLTGFKLDGVTGGRLSGAAYTLYRNGNILAVSISDGSGKISFPDLAPGEYELKETSAPDGYQMSDQVYTILVDADGSVTIDGLPAENYAFYDGPLTSFSFPKTDAVTGLPLSGAVFMLTEDGRSAVSDQNGRVDFGFSVVEGDSFITGSGAPGAEISVTLPDGAQVQASVRADGFWLVPVPAGVALQAGQTLYAHQTLPGYAKSEEASFEVQAKA